MPSPKSSPPMPSPPRNLVSPESTATVRVSSPLNPLSATPSPATPPIPLPLTGSPPYQFRLRGRSADTLRGLPSSSTLGSSPNLVSSNSLSPTPRPTSGSFSDQPMSTFRSRSRSIEDKQSPTPPQSGTPPNGAPSSWWGGSEVIPRPWRDVPRKKKTVPTEQTEGWIHTKERVAQAALSVLGVAGDITHEALLLSVELLDYAPVPGLQVAAKTLLNIWDAVQNVDMNRLACLRLTERCAEILLAIRQEVQDAGDSVGQELAMPIAKLIESFTQVLVFLQKQQHRPFLKRYLKRDEILRQIAGCDAGLGDALGMFSLSIQIRILKQVQAAEMRRQADTQELLHSLLSPRSSMSAPPNALMLTGMESDHDGLPASPLPESPTAMSPSQILPTLRTLHLRQNSLDAAHDMVDLRQLMRAALQTSSDVEMLEVLQVGREEMPEAIKTLQRALERVVEKDEGEVMTRAVVEEEPAGLRRSKTITSETTSSMSEGKARDTLDREFIESGIDALRRMSEGVESSLPSWTITRYEVDRESKIGIGFFSDVYKGTWRGRTVAIKVLAESTPRDLFVREVGIWKTLQHPNVLELYGASSASGDPPWFFVSPYEKNGSLVEYLRRVSMEGGVGMSGLGIGWSGSRGRTASFPMGSNGSPVMSPGKEALLRGSIALGAPLEPKKEWDLYRFMHEVAKGMEYLHSQGVLHGDLKAANVLVDDRIHCVISDFGQSEMKSEAYRISGTPPPHGTLRWQAPELMAGLGQLTTEMDVYAFAITCVEILSMGRMPWPLMDDSHVRHFVLKENTRPPVPQTQFSTEGLQKMLDLCWHHDPFARPPFSQIVREMKRLRKSGGQNIEESPRPPRISLDEPSARVSPSLCPAPLPATPPTDFFSNPFAWPLSGSPGTPSTSVVTSSSFSKESHREDTVGTRVLMPEPVFYTPSAPSSRASSLFSHTPSTQSEENLDVVDFQGYESPPPADERLAEIKNERRYRMLLSHEFHPSLTLPLWTPSVVDLGAVGYLSKPKGAFVTLFNSFDPKATVGLADMPSLYGYGRLTAGSQRQDKRNAAQRGLDAFVGLLQWKNNSVSQSVSRRYSFPLRSGHKAAYMCTESTVYRYMESLDTPKKWFKANVDSIMEMYGAQHRIQKEDLFLVIGTLDASDYGLLVSHNHNDGHAHFNVYSGSRSGHPWGTFTTDTEVPHELGPSYNEPTITDPVSASKVSTSGGPWDTLLLARLRFKPDATEPTSL